MKAGEIYEIPHECYVCKLEFEDETITSVFGRNGYNYENRFDSVEVVNGYRCIELVAKVRNHWVIDTWLSAGENFTRPKAQLMTHANIVKITKGLKSSVNV